MLFYLFSDNILVCLMNIVLDEKLTASLMKDVYNWNAQYGRKVNCECSRSVQMQNHFTENIFHKLSFAHEGEGFNPFSIIIRNNKFIGINIFPSLNSWDTMRGFDVYKNTVNIFAISKQGTNSSQIEINNIRELLSLIKHTISGIIDESSYEWMEREPYFDFLYNMTFWDAMMGNDESDEEIVIEI